MELKRRLNERDRLLFPGIKKVIEEVTIDDDPPEPEASNGGGFLQNFTRNEGNKRHKSKCDLIKTKKSLIWTNFWV